jgi:uncharacterized repeat protein (TIGR03806 family)
MLGRRLFPARSWWLVLAMLAASCGEQPPESPADPSCATPSGSGVNLDPAEPPCTMLSSYRLFRGGRASQEPNERVMPYDVITPLFSDYASKARFFHIPPGASVGYSPDSPFDFPVGSVLVKTFYYPHDERHPDEGRRLIETRLLVRRAEGWVGLPYVWNDAQTDAELRVAGVSTEVQWVPQNGQMRTVTYVSPNSNQCKHCHDLTPDAMSPIGIQARHVNHEFEYAEGAENQIGRWTREGILAGAPEPPDAPKDAKWDDPASGSLNDRARAYLEINCAHCHSPTGNASLKQLELAQNVTDPQKLGICSLQGAQRKGDGTAYPFNIDPGHPEKSRIIARLSSTDPEYRMPRIGRSVVHDEGLGLITEWIAKMPGMCE